MVGYATTEFRGARVVIATRYACFGKIYTRAQQVQYPPEEARKVMVWVVLTLLNAIDNNTRYTTTSICARRLSSLIWTYNTGCSRSVGDDPFLLAKTASTVNPKIPPPPPPHLPNQFAVFIACVLYHIHLPNCNPFTCAKITKLPHTNSK